MNLRRSACLVAAPFLLCWPLQAQQFHVVVDAQASSQSLQGSYGADLDASVIGDYDAATNPGGTRTVPGLFGGSGNNAIPMDLGLSGTLSSTQAPLGSFDLDLDRLAGTLVCSNLAVDLLGGGSATSDVSVDLLYSTFRTFAPDSLFPGGIPVTLPLGSQAISQGDLAQTAPAVGTLTPTGTLGQYLFLVSVPASITLTVDVNGSPTPVGPFDTLLPFSGTLDVTGAALSTSLSLNLAVQQTVLDPLPGFQITDIPFPVPTVLPAGGTANLLLNGTVAQGDVNVSWTANLVASGAAGCGFSSYCEVSPNTTGLPGLLAVSGSSTVADANLTLDATQLPTNVFGIFLMSPAQDRIALPAPGSGFLCMGSPFYRFSSQIVFSGAAGAVTFPLDFQNLPQGQTFQAGSTWNFQLWHRDSNPGPTSNTTRAVTVVFCP
ncbi:MAG TPA: hypothetical protein P5218_05490 [Planctomycetota bacterium]|nr:hypothetical protein [Planctomycetota bacterium]